jgi:hypothetical protein
MVGTQEAASLGERTPQPNAPPWTVVVLALGLGGALVGGTTTGGYLLTHNTLSPSPLAPPLVIAPAAVVAPIAQQPSDWRALLSAASCAAPCSGGQLCASKAIECTSGLACVPGTGAERFADGESWALHLSAVQELDGTGQLVDPCQSQKDFWVCRAGTSTCASQVQACANSGPSAMSIPVSGSELDHLGLSLDVHVGGPSGPIVGVTSPIRSLRRGGLCKGFVVKASGGGLAKVTYFVLPT